MKLRDLIIELEKLDSQGKTDYDIWITDGEVEKSIEIEQVNFSDQYREIMLG